MSDTNLKNCPKCSTPMHMQIDLTALMMRQKNPGLGMLICDQCGHSEPLTAGGILDTLAGDQTSKKSKSEVGSGSSELDSEKLLSSIILDGDLRTASHVIRDAISKADEHDAWNGTSDIDVGEYEDVAFFAVSALRNTAASGQPLPAEHIATANDLREIAAKWYKSGSLTQFQILITVGAMLMELTRQGSQSRLPLHISRIASFCDYLLSCLDFEDLDAVLAEYGIVLKDSTVASNTVPSPAKKPWWKLW